MTPATLESLIEAARRAETIEDIHTLCSQLCEESGFEYFLYGATFPTSLVKPYQVIISGYPDPWREHYESRRYVAIDPTVKHCMDQIVPLDWEQLKKQRDLSPKVAQFLGEAGEFGLTQGATVSIHGARGDIAMLSIATPDQERDHNRRVIQALPYVQLLGTYIHDAVQRIIGAVEEGLPNAALTRREQECLVWSAEGKSSWETGRILGISENTVIFHLRNAGRKLNVSNRQQAVARAISLGLIKPVLISE